MSSPSSSDEEINPSRCLKVKMKQSQILEAVQRNDVGLLKVLLTSPRWYKVRDQNNDPLLHIAMMRDSRQVFDYLLSLPDYPLEAINDGGKTALMTVLSAGFYMLLHPDISYYIREDFACKLIKRGANVHHNPNDGNLLHNALEHNMTELAELLIKKGVDVNKQNFFENTPLHGYCTYWDSENFVEVVMMLLFEGADPLIRNRKGYTPFDLILKFAAGNSIEVETILIAYITSQYIEHDIHVEAFLMAAGLNSLIFSDIIKNSREIVFGEYELNHYVSMLFIIPTHCLQIIIEEFDYVVKELLRAKFVQFMHYEKPILVENFYVLMDSKLQFEFTDWLSTVIMSEAIWNLLHFQKSDLSTVEGIICFLLSYGMKVFEEDLEIVYQEFGYCELFKILLHMDVDRRLSRPIRSIMPYILYNVTLDIPKMILNRRILRIAKCDSDFELLLPYYTIPFELLESCNLQKGQKQGRVPLLRELARDAFRRYFVDRLGIKNAKQFYTLVNKLPIAEYHKQILTLEARLY